MPHADDNDAGSSSGAPKPVRSGIAGWAEDERPRERLLTRGAHALTDAELLAILLRVGVQGKSAVELGRELLARFGSVQAMMAAPLVAWDGIKGLGGAKLAQLQAALELGRRAALPVAREERFFKNTGHAAEYFAARRRRCAFSWTNAPAPPWRVGLMGRGMRSSPSTMRRGGWMRMSSFGKAFAQGWILVTNDKDFDEKVYGERRRIGASFEMRREEG